MILLLASCAPDSPPGQATRFPPVSEPLWKDEPLPELVLARRFLALLPRPAPLTVRCEAEGDPEEVHQLTVPADQAYVEAVLYGLLAETSYRCALAADGFEGDAAFTTGPLPDWLPSWRVESAGEPFGAYVLLNHGTSRREDRETKLLVVDVDGRLRWYQPVDYNAPDLDAQHLGGGKLLYGGGYQVPPILGDLSWTVERIAPELAGGERYNHHVERLADDTVLTLGTAPVRGEGERWRGFQILVLDPTLQSVRWSWDSQRGYDEGWLPHPEPEDTDPYHVNAIGVFPDGDVWANARSLSELYRIDRETGERRWTMGPGGDFRLVDEAGEDADPADWFYMPHAPEFHGDRLFVYDNGVGRPGGSFSRVAEYRVDERARTVRLVWSFTEPDWYEPIWGDVDLLPNGHVSFTRAHCSTCTARETLRTEVVEVDPANDQVVWRLTFQDPDDAGYRSERIGGCELFAHRGYCPE